MYLVFGALMLSLVLLGVRWFITADAQQLARIARMGLIGVAVLALVFLSLSGRLPALLTGVLSLLPFFPYARRLWQENITHDTRDSLEITGKITRKQALDILGLGEDADEQQIRQAHRRLVQKIHPDKGGSVFLAAQVNQARDVLLP